MENGSDGEEAGSRVPKLLLVLGLVFMFAMVLNQDDGNGTSSETSTPPDPYAGEVSDGRSFGEVLATEQTGSADPDESLVRRFNSLLDGIADECGQSREWVSDRVLTGHQTLTRKGGDATIRDVAEGWREAVRGPGEQDCTGALATLLAVLDGEEQ